MAAQGVLFRQPGVLRASTTRKAIPVSSLQTIKNTIQEALVRLAKLLKCILSEDFQHRVNVERSTHKATEVWHSCQARQGPASQLQGVGA